MAKKQTLKQKKAQENKYQEKEKIIFGASKSIWTTGERLTRFGLIITEIKLAKLKAKRIRQLKSLVAKSTGKKKRNYERRLYAII